MATSAKLYTTMFKQFSYLFLFLSLWSCQQPAEEEQPPTLEEKTPSQAEKIIEEAIAAHGGDVVDKSLTTFLFRDRRYEAARRGGKYEYKRIFRDSVNNYVEDVLSNDGFYRLSQGEKVDLPAERSAAFANSVNSVIYFAFLPYFLNDPAVQSAYLGTETIKSAPYHKIKITFEQEKGGKDYEDEFIYWFHQDSLTMDYLAYNYITDGGGARFRSAYNIRRIDGIRFADYVNYKPQEKRRDIENFGQLYEEGVLEELSKIETENIEVTRLK